MQNKLNIEIKSLSLPACTLVSLLLVFTAVSSVLATPKFNALSKPPVLENVVPKQLGEWKEKPSTYAQVSVNTYTQAISDAIYDQVLMRTYQNSSGNQVMLALAYAGEQRQEIKIHQVEVCYPAQGFQLISMQNHVFNIKGNPVPINGKRLIFKKGNKIEAVSYWIRLGNSFPMSGLQMRLKILREGLKGKIDDGVLVRVSTLIEDESEAPAAYELQEQFLADLLVGVVESAPRLLVN
ncbi:MAG: EpsI family protein [Methylotenera sp.]|uniref:exosortase-associated protein EpsI, B-type n=1 Tax=Methylotenera sp. TaxID=2051956 RepID=UPI0018566997|nr:exosortase-associated protein EpsI, B-type [Methylotenera sp.]NOU25201.1 EpsI family protein [Methylotenera sp.]